MEKPLVSVSTITYNHAPYIRQCIEGILMQKTDFPIELLIHDDASSDGTEEIIREYEKKYTDIVKPIYEKENQWQKGRRGSPIFNFPRAKGKYIALCEGDDYWTDPLKLQKQVDFLENNVEFSMCTTNLKNIDCDGNVIDENVVSVDFQRELTQADVITKFTPRTPTVVFKKKFLNIKNISKSPIGDIVLFASLTENGKCGYIDILSAAYRVHQGGVFSSLSLYKRLKNQLKSRKIILKKIKLNEDAKYKTRRYCMDKYKQMLKILIDNKKYKGAIRLYFEFLIFKLFYV